MDKKYTRTLIVTAHPSSHGLTHGIAQVLKEKREEDGGEVEILDLYKTDIKQEFTVFENMKDLWAIPDATRQVMQKKISDSTELIFIHPIWWLSMPAIMKNFIDQNITSHFAYQFIDGKRVGLLKGKTARVYVTCDAPLFLYFLLAFPFVTQWAIGILIYCGVDVDNFTIIRNRAFKTDQERAIYLKKLKKKSYDKSLFLGVLNFIGRIVQ